jgi:ferric-dicitrate binding protein FerR (iron transport regulator)
MPLSDEVRNLLLKYIAGETNEEESEQVEGWLADDPKIFEEFEQLWDLWYAVGTATNVFRFNVDKGWEEVLRKSRQAGSGRRDKKEVRKIILWAGGIAAGLLLLSALGLWLKDEQGSSGMRQQRDNELSAVATDKNKTTGLSSDSSGMDVKTDLGQRKKVRLPDGSLVWLNGNTSIHFMDQDSKRIAFLSGQAFFDIQHNAGKPFIVETRHATVSVLGTRFDITAYPKDSVTEAVLTEGSILFTTEMKDKSFSRHILPGEKVSVNHLSDHVNITQVDTAFYTYWRDGRLLFDGQTFAEIAKAVGHKYGVQFEFTDQELPEKRLNGYLEKESLQEALEALRLTLQFSYRIVGRTVIIYQ